MDSKPITISNLTLDISIINKPNNIADECIYRRNSITNCDSFNYVNISTNYLNHKKRKYEHAFDDN